MNEALSNLEATRAETARLRNVNEQIAVHIFEWTVKHNAGSGVYHAKQYSYDSDKTYEIGDTFAGNYATDPEWSKGLIKKLLSEKVKLTANFNEKTAVLIDPATGYISTKTGKTIEEAYCLVALDWHGSKNVKVVTGEDE